MHGRGSINYVRETIEQYDIELQLDLKFRRKSHLSNDYSSDNNDDLEDNKDMELVESGIFRDQPKIGSNVNTFL